MQRGRDVGVVVVFNSEVFPLGDDELLYEARNSKNHVRVL